MPEGFSCGRHSLEGRQGDMQVVTLSPLNSSSGTGSNASSFLAALRMEWRFRGGVPSRHREEPSPNSCQMCLSWGHLPPMARWDLVTSGCVKQRPRGDWQQGLSQKLCIDKGVHPKKKVTGILF